MNIKDLLVVLFIQRALNIWGRSGAPKFKNK
jgi:hypothetical protein